MEDLIQIIALLCWVFVIVLLSLPMWMPSVIVLLDHLKSKKKEEYDSFKNSPKL